MGAGLVRNNNFVPFGTAEFAGTLLGPEATLGWLEEIRARGVVPPFWWWGVVFGNWIVVASI